MSPHFIRLRDKVLSDDPLIRAMSYQSVLSAFAEGTFLTGSAVFFTQIVGLSAAQVGLGLTIAGVATFLFAVPLGRLADRLGTRFSWIAGAVLQALLFGAWVLVGDFAAYVAVEVLLALAASWQRSGRDAYRISVFPAATRVRGFAYMRAARNVGYTLGALASGLALAADSDTLIKAVPLMTAVVLLVNAYWISRLPRLATAASPGDVKKDVRDRLGALRNRAFLATTFFDGVLGTHQVLLNVVIPLWLVQETDAPRVLLAWLFGTNTIMAVGLQVIAARGVTDVATSLRAERRGALCFLASCAIIAVTHDTVGLLTIALVWIGHVTVTGAELFQSAGEWGLIADLSDPERRGDYQGAAQVGYTLGTVWAPAAYTFLAMELGHLGWAIIAGIIVIATIALHPAARAAECYLARQPQPVPAPA
ncbi:MFS transporter [Nocardioides sp. NPDC057772]|uniref:MFS transporter n=1 Tax=Nocardioides sp. NPDC057772 TaxID=3346245 RepID=UPI00367204CC